MIATVCLTLGVFFCSLSIMLHGTMIRDLHARVRDLEKQMEDKKDGGN